MTLKQIKIKAVEQALISSNGNKTKAAKELGVSKRSLANWVREYSVLSKFRIDPPHAGQKIRRAA